MAREKAVRTVKWVAQLQLLGDWNGLVVCLECEEVWHADQWRAHGGHCPSSGCKGTPLDGRKLSQESIVDDGALSYYASHRGEL